MTEAGPTVRQYGAIVEIDGREVRFAWEPCEGCAGKGRGCLCDRPPHPGEIHTPYTRLCEACADHARYGLQPGQRPVRCDWCVAYHVSHPNDPCPSCRDGFICEEVGGDEG